MCADWLKNRVSIKAAKYEIQKLSTGRATLFRCKFSLMFPVFHLAWSTCRATRTFVAGDLKKVVAKIRVWVYFEQQILALLLVFHQTLDLLCNKFACALANQQSGCRISSTCNKCFCCSSSWSCKVKNGKHRQKLAMKQCCATSWRFLYLVFHHLNSIESQNLHELLT